jgi:ankyrin repeat protein
MALMLVAGNGRRVAVLQLLKEGANVNTANRNGETALHYVAASKNRGLQFEYTLIMLLRHGADVNIRSGDCFAPLTLAICSNRMFMAKILLDHGAVVWNRAGFIKHRVSFSRHVPSNKVINPTLPSFNVFIYYML